MGDLTRQDCTKAMTAAHSAEQSANLMEQYADGKSAMGISSSAERLIREQMDEMNEMGECTPELIQGFKDREADAGERMEQAQQKTSAPGFNSPLTW